MTRPKFKELEEILDGMYVLVSQVENAKENTPVSAQEAKSTARDFAALRERAFRWIKEYITVNTPEVDKHILQQIAAGLEKLESVNTQFAPATMNILIQKLRKF